MKRLSGSVFFSAALFVLCSGFFPGGTAPASADLDEPCYKPDWASLKTHPIPQWLREGKFGIYTRWGVYSVPAMGPNAAWYANKVYWEADSAEAGAMSRVWGSRR